MKAYFVSTPSPSPRQAYYFLQMRGRDGALSWSERFDTAARFQSEGEAKAAVARLTVADCHPSMISDARVFSRDVKGE